MSYDSSFDYWQLILFKIGLSEITSRPGVEFIGPVLAIMAH